MKKVVVLTGAGMSAESGLSTFRDAGGLWEQYAVEDVATPEGYARNPELVISFYNERRRQLADVKPCRGHELLAQLEKDFRVTVITQNVDDLHERAGSTHVIHLHGELMKVTSSRNPDNPACIRTLKPEEWQVRMGDKAADGSQLRPYIVWFGEPVPAIEPAIEETMQADVFVVIGTSLNVYPAAGPAELRAVRRAHLSDRPPAGSRDIGPTGDAPDERGIRRDGGADRAVKKIKSILRCMWYFAKNVVYLHR